MMNILRKLSIGIASLALLIFQAQSAIAENQSDIEKKAKQITVKIFSDNSGLTSSSPEGSEVGSGVLFRKNNNDYYVITNAHVVKEDDEYYVQISDEQDSDNPFSAISSKQLNHIPVRLIKKCPVLPNMGPQQKCSSETVLNVVVGRYPARDIALLKFSSDASYTVSQEGNSSNLVRETPIYLGGFPLGTQEFNLIGLKITQPVTEQLFITYKPIEKNNRPVSGTSGGSLLNQQGELIGIHEGEEKNNQIGIPLQTILIGFGQDLEVTPKTINFSPNIQKDSPNIQKETTIILNLSPSATNVPVKTLVKPIVGTW